MWNIRQVVWLIGILIVMELDNIAYGITTGYAKSYPLFMGVVWVLIMLVPLLFKMF